MSSTYSSVPMSNLKETQHHGKMVSAAQAGEDFWGDAVFSSLEMVVLSKYLSSHLLSRHPFVTATLTHAHETQLECSRYSTHKIETCL